MADYSEVDPNARALVDFLVARLDEDEWIAQGAARTDDGHSGRWVPVHFGAGGFDARVDDHIARHDPARVLREVEAKRIRIAELQLRRHDWNPLDEYYSCSQAATDGSDIPGSGCSDPDRRGQPCDCGRDQAVERGLRLEAGVYSDHPDYDQKWAP